MFYNPLTRYPSILIFSIIALFFVIDQFKSIFRKGLRKTISLLNPLEYFSLSWIIGVISAVSVVSYRPDRRYVTLILPLSILALAYYSREGARPEFII